MSMGVSQRVVTIAPTTARRLLLGAQGLLDDPTRPAAPESVYRLIDQLGYVQIDSINMIERAHHLTLFSRLDQYKPEMFRSLLEDSRRLFEHWTHDASAIPTHLYPHWKHRFLRHRRKIREHAWWRQRIGPNPLRTVRKVRQRIEREGALSSKDFEHDHDRHPLPEDGWWGWKPAKAALEYLWRTGELAVARRVNFQKVYDLAERILIDHHHLPAPPKGEHVDWACRSAMERLIIATPAEVAAFWNAVTLAEARQWCARALISGDIIEALIESDDGSKPRTALALPDWQEHAAQFPPPPYRIRLLSPFDPVVRNRQRMQRLFNFDYRFEAFVPAPRRKFGYYVLPMLEGDRLIGRMDAAFKRERGVLEVNRIWLEPHVKSTKSRRVAVHEALEMLAAFIGAKQIDGENRIEIHTAPARQ